jgi:hypothetical protein
MVKNLIVCGDSFSQAVNREPYLKTHWSELLSERLNLNLINLAHSGCSNRMVSFQIMETLKFSDTLTVIVPSSTFARFDILLDPDANLKKINGLADFKYTRRNPPQHFRETFPFIESKNLHEFEDDAFSLNFLSSKIPWELYKHIDKWALFYALSQLVRNERSFLLINGIFHPAQLPYDPHEFKEIFGDRFVVDESEFSFVKYGIDKHINKTFVDPGYHTLPEDQIAISIEIENLIMKRNLCYE